MNVNRLYRFAQHCDTVIQRQLRPNARNILMYVRGPMNYAVMEPIFKRMNEDQRLTFYLAMTNDTAHKSNLLRRGRNGFEFVSLQQAKYMKFDVCLTADFIWTSLPRGTRRVQLFHGVAGKYATVYDTPTQSAREWDRLFFINKRRLRNFIRSKAIDGDSPAARLVGMPKVDCLVDGTFSRTSVLKMLGIDPARKVVLYAPTWSAQSSLVSMGQEVVERLIASGNSVILKLHDRSYDPEHAHSGGINWIERLGPLLRKSGGHLATNSNSCPYLAAADVLVTDHSSAGFEYLLLDRPLVRIEVPELLATANVNPEYVKLLASVSTTVRSAREVCDAVERSLAEPARKSEIRREVARDLFYCAGEATSRAVKELYDLMELSAPELCRSSQVNTSSYLFEPLT